MRKNAKKATKRTCSMALAAVLAFAPVTVFGATDTANHWANAVISDWESKGLIKGYEDGTFKPDNSVSRAEFVTMMNNVLKNDAEGTVSFTDVKETDWFYQAVAAAVNAGYCKGYEDGTFKPSATISRAEAAVLQPSRTGSMGNPSQKTRKGKSPAARATTRKWDERFIVYLPPLACISSQRGWRLDRLCLFPAGCVGGTGPPHA